MKTKGGYIIENFRTLDQPIDRANLEPHIYEGLVKDVPGVDNKKEDNLITWDKFGRCSNFQREDCFIETAQIHIENKKKKFLDLAFAKFGKKANESINFEQAFEILDEIEQRTVLSDETLESAANRYAESENSCYTNDYYGYLRGAKDVRDIFAPHNMNSENKEGS